MKMTFRWYGDDDPVTLAHVRQIPGMTGYGLCDRALGAVHPNGLWEGIAEEKRAHG